jgi:D-amino-acid dehydrogenase
MLEDWGHIDDPKQLVTAVRNKVKMQGAVFITGRAVSVGAKTDGACALLTDGQQIMGDKVLVAAGAWSALLARSLGDKVLLESERGYNTTLPRSASRLNREVIFAERRFVATPLSVGLRIGGAAEFAGLDKPANHQRSQALLQLAHRFIPNLDERDSQQWMGHRPATPDSLPVIGASPKNANVLYAFGHGHLGLTQAATTGELIGNLLQGKPPEIDMSPYAVGRF